MCKVYSYLRVSTDKQDTNNQRHEVETYAKGLGLEVNEWIEVEISSGKSIKDRRIDELLAKLRRGDILICTELSRLARSIREALVIVGKLSAKKVNLHLIKENVRTNGTTSADTDFFMAAMSYAAQKEKEMISLRTKAALARLKANNVKLGNDNIHTINQARQEKASKDAERLRATLEAYVANGMNQRQIVEALNSAGILTPRGKTWSLVQVQRVLKRLGLVTIKAKPHCHLSIMM